MIWHSGPVRIIASMMWTPLLSTVNISSVCQQLALWDDVCWQQGTVAMTGSRPELRCRLFACSGMSVGGIEGTTLT